jgi:hypothetical protein
MSAPKLVEPYGCGRCGIPLPHGQQTGPGGLHGWERPSDVQILARMKARRLARVVARQGALPVPVASVPGLLPEDLATIAALIGGAKPAVPGLLVQLGESVRDVRAHDHSTQCEDWYCLNLTSFMGERMGPVLRRLVDAEARVAELEAQRERRRVRLVALQNDALSMRGSLSPMGEDRKVPVPLGETLTPAVDWLIGRVAELEAERHETNESLSLAAESLRENRDRIAELEALQPAAIQICRKCGAGYTYREPCSVCTFKARMAAELGGQR